MPRASRRSPRVRRAEETLRQTLSLLTATLDATADGILVVDLNARVTSYNRQFAEMWRIPQDLLAARDDNALLAFVLDQLEAPEAFLSKVRLLYGDTEAESHDTLTFKDGRVFERYSKPQNVADTVVGRVWSFRDVTRQRRAERALQDALAWQGAVVEGSRDAIFVSDATSRFVMVNAAAAELTGYSREQLLQMHIPDLHDQEDLAAYRQYHRAIIAGEEHVTEARVRRQDGTKVEVEFNNRRIVVDGTPYMHTVARDVTERRAAAAQLESHVRRNVALARLGQLALEGPPIAVLLAEATARTAELLAVEYSGVLRLVPEDNHLQLVAGAGWQPGVVGGVTVVAGEGSLAGFTLRAEAPVIVRDFATESRFTTSPHLHEHGVRSAVSAIVAGRGAPYGILGAYACQPREFTSADVQFLTVVANVIAQAIIRRHGEQTLTNLIHRLISAQEEERRSLARELHDETGQALTSMLVGLRRLEAAGAPDTVAEIASQLRDVAQQTLEDVSRLAQGLRPSVLDDLGLVPALSRYVSEHASIHGLTVHTQITGFDGTRLPAPVEITLYRIAQEALTNVARHASAKEVELSLSRAGRLVHLVVQDDGRGFDPHGVAAPGRAAGHLGIYGIRERAALLNGTADLRSAPGRGTTLTVIIPLEE